MTTLIPSANADFESVKLLLRRASVREEKVADIIRRALRLYLQKDLDDPALNPAGIQYSHFFEVPPAGRPFKQRAGEDEWAFEKRKQAAADKKLALSDL